MVILSIWNGDMCSVECDFLVYDVCCTVGHGTGNTSAVHLSSSVSSSVS